MDHGLLIMNKSSIINRRSSIHKGFTLLESVIALAVASIALLALLQLQLVGMNTADKAQGMTQAVLLAQEKMAEALSAGYPPIGTKSGTVEADGDQFTWQLEVTDARLPEPVMADAARQSYLPSSDRNRLRKLSVDVTWQKGPGQKHVGLTTYVAQDKIRDV
jgi:general secretion pathway protein I